MLESKKKKQKTWVKCYVALGSNMGDSQAYLNQAIKDLKAHSKIHNICVSKFYQSKPHGPQDQPDYLNAAASLETSLSAIALLHLLQQIENDNDRVREGIVRWGARTLDLDVLFYGDETIDTRRLTVPHPRICERAFVLYPLRDLVGTETIENLKINSNTSILDCIEALTPNERNNIKELNHD